MAEALAHVGYPIQHVSAIFPSLGNSWKGQSDASDEDIARWCAQTKTVLIATDEDFRGQHVRSGVLAGLGAEVIVFEHDLKGLRVQHERITKHFSDWEVELSREVYGHKVWLQGRGRIRLKPGTGRRRNSKSRYKDASN